MPKKFMITAQTLLRRPGAVIKDNIKMKCINELMIHIMNYYNNEYK